MNEEITVYYRAETTHDLAVHKEFQETVAFTAPVVIFCNCFMILVMAFLCFVLCFSDYPAAFSRSYVWIIGIYLLITFLPKLINRKGDINYKRMVQANQGVPVHSIYEFTDDTIHVCNFDFQNTGAVRYDQITKILESKNLFILMMKYQQGFTIERKSLSDQNEAFVDFLKQNCTKLKRKKVLTGKFGKFTAYAKSVIITIALILSIWNLPIVQKLLIPEGQLSNYSSCYTIVAELEKLGITGIDETALSDFEEFYNGYESYYTSPYEKIIDLLCWMGYGEVDLETSEWIPATGGVFWLEFESYDVENTYSDFLKGVSALDSSLQWTDIQEDLSSVDWNHNQGVQAATFVWNGHTHRIEGDVDYDWFDVKAADQLNAIIKSKQNGKQLYFAYDGDSGCLIFYRDSHWAKTFTEITGIPLYESASQMYYGI